MNRISPSPKSSTISKHLVREILCPCLLTGLLILLVESSLWGQGINPYPNAITDKLIHHETPMKPPGVNTPFLDPDLGSQMVRVTDEASDFVYAVVT